MHAGGPIGYTTEEVRYLIAPLFGLSAEDLSHFAILIDDASNSRYRMIGCGDAMEFLKGIMHEGLGKELHNHSRKGNVGNERKGRLEERHGMARGMLRLPFRRNRSGS